MPGRQPASGRRRHQEVGKRLFPDSRRATPCSGSLPPHLRIKPATDEHSGSCSRSRPFVIGSSKQGGSGRQGGGRTEDTELPTSGHRPSPAAPRRPLCILLTEGSGRRVVGWTALVSGSACAPLSHNTQTPCPVHPLLLRSIQDNWRVTCLSPSQPSVPGHCAPAGVCVWIQPPQRGRAHCTPVYISVGEQQSRQLDCRKLAAAWEKPAISEPAQS